MTTVLENFKAWLCGVSFKIYLSRSLTTWTDRTWDFAVALFLIHLSPNSFKLTAIYSFISRGSVLVFGPVLGDWIDRTKRLPALRCLLIIRNFLAVLCCIILIVVLHNKVEVSQFKDGIFTSFFQVLVITLAGLVRLATLGSILCVEKDWIVVITADDKAKLANMNASIRRIDLATGAIAPILVGQIMTYTSDLATCIFFIIWFTISLVVECLLIRSIYKTIPSLADKTSDLLQVEAEYDPTHPPKYCQYNLRSILIRIKRTLSGGYIYWRQPVFLTGFALSLLYITVLGFDGITTVYAYSQGLTESIVSILMAVSAGVGVISSFAFPPLRKKFSLACTGVFALSFQVSCLTLCVGSIWAAGSPFDPSELQVFSLGKAMSHSVNFLNNDTMMAANATSKPIEEMTSIIIFMTGVVSSRFGLWLADLSISQIYQEYVPESERGLVNSIQNSLNMVLALIKYMLVICIPNPKTFAIHILISFSAISFALISMFAYYCKHPRQVENCKQKNNCDSKINDYLEETEL